ncbi:MAG: S53 family peptidase, partial [Solirubrobacteraceae bacterium]
GTARQGPIATGGPEPCAQAVDDAPGSGGYTADQIASYYGFSPLYRAGDKGQGVTVALYELESDSPADIAAFERCYGTHTPVSYIKVDGGAGSGSGSGEAALDIDQVIGLAPKVNLLVYQGPNTNSGSGPYDLYAKIADQDRASVVSSSWGNCEGQETDSSAQAEQTVFEQMAIQGQTLVAATGDSGSEDCFLAGANADNSLAVDDPAAQPFVTGVGGTSLELGVFNLGGNHNHLYPNPNPPETVWNNSYPGLQYQATWGITPGAGGGGISRFWPMPSYQSDAGSAAPWLNLAGAASSGTACGAAAGSYCREVPDVSADADPMDGYMSYYNGQNGHGATLHGWQSVGGTSAAAPLWASIFALSDASAACAGNLVGFADPALYSLAASSPSAYAGYFNDVTADAINGAGNDNDLVASGNTSGLYQAGSGYDMATGLGTPHAAQLAAGLCRASVHVRVAGARRVFVGAHVHLRLRAALPRGVSGTVVYTAKHLPAGLRLNRGSGVVSGTLAGPGIYATVFSARSAGGVYGAHLLRWSVARHPAASLLRLTAPAGDRPLLSFTLRSGRLEPPLLSITVQLPAGLSLRRPLRAITVTGAAGNRVPRRLRIRDGRLVIILRQAHSPDRIRFGAGALVASGPLTTGSRRRLRLGFTVVDAAGDATKLWRTLRPVP